MNDQEIIIEVAKLDGFEVRYRESGLQPHLFKDGGCYPWEQPYLTSRDAIIPVIQKIITNEKIEKTFNYTLYDILEKEQVPDNHAFTYVMAVFATPRQLCIALLKTTHNGKI